MKKLLTVCYRNQILTWFQFWRFLNLVLSSIGCQVIRCWNLPLIPLCELEFVRDGSEKSCLFCDLTNNQLSVDSSIIRPFQVNTCLFYWFQGFCTFWQFYSTWKHVCQQKSHIFISYLSQCHCSVFRISSP